MPGSKRLRLARSVSFPKTGGAYSYDRYDYAEATTWLADCESALAHVFPFRHPVRKRWDSAVAPTVKDSSEAVEPTVIDAARAILESARGQLKAGRLKSLAQGVQAETVGELLDQAEALVAEDYRVAATVIAGGALETHLKHLCERAGLSWEEPGSINAYDTSIARHRSQTGDAAYPTTDSDQAKGWGKKRNSAAHNPGDFRHDDAEVRLMIEGIRQFVARNPGLGLRTR